MLRSQGITLVLDVKLSVLERLSRCLQCDIVTSIDSNIGRPKLGSCGKFYIKNFQNPEGASKTLMFLEPLSSSPRGCCVLLRGGDIRELVKVKHVALLMLFARYNWRFELSFLLDEFAQPPSPKPNIFDSKDYSPCDLMENQVGQTRAEDATTQRIELKPKKFADKKVEEKSVTKENVKDFSDPLRATDLSPSSFDPENSVEFAVETPYDNRFRTALNSTVLSISPYSNFPLPYLETETGRKCILRSRFPNELYYSKHWSENIEKYSTQNDILVAKNVLVDVDEVLCTYYCFYCIIRT